MERITGRSASAAAGDSAGRLGRGLKLHVLEGLTDPRVQEPSDRLELRLEGFAERALTDGCPAC